MNVQRQTQTIPKTTSNPSYTPVSTGLLQRKCACGQHTVSGECVECRQKREGSLQRAEINPAPVSDVPSTVHDVLRSPGQPLDPATRAFMEPRFGHDFSQVRVHTDAKAAESARAVNALAYTVGQNVVFGVGQYAPEAEAGKRRLAHELAHVVQQTQNHSVVILRPASDDSEADARRAVTAIFDLQAESVGRISPMPIQLARQNDPPRREGSRISTGDMDDLKDTMLRLMEEVDEKTRQTVTRDKTIVIGLVLDPDGQPTRVYTVSGNWTNPKLREAADKLGLTRWEATPRATSRGKVGAPGDAEQIMIEAADANDFRVKGMAVSREVCEDCKLEIRSYDQGRIRVVEVGVPKGRLRIETGKRLRIETGVEAEQEAALLETAERERVEALKKRVRTRARQRGFVELPVGKMKSVGKSLAKFGAALIWNYVMTKIEQRIEKAILDPMIEEKMSALEPTINARVNEQIRLVANLQRSHPGKPVFANIRVLTTIYRASGEDEEAIGVDVALESVTVSAEKIERHEHSRIWVGSYLTARAPRDLIKTTYSAELEPLNEEQLRAIRSIEEEEEQAKAQRQQEELAAEKVRKRQMLQERREMLAAQEQAGPPPVSKANLLPEARPEHGQPAFVFPPWDDPTQPAQGVADLFEAGKEELVEQAAELKKASESGAMSEDEYGRRYRAFVRSRDEWKANLHKSIELMEKEKADGRAISRLRALEDWLGQVEGQALFEVLPQPHRAAKSQKKKAIKTIDRVPLVPQTGGARVWLAKDSEVEQLSGPRGKEVVFVKVRVIATGMIGEIQPRFLTTE